MSVDIFGVYLYATALQKTSSVTSKILNELIRLTQINLVWDRGHEIFVISGGIATRT